jgi:hypothetical protein
MSIVEGPGPAFDPRQIRSGGYGLVVASLAVAVAALFERSALLAAADIAFAVACVGVALWRPELFEVAGRGKSRGLNPLFIAPAGLVCYAGITEDFVSLSPLLIAGGVGAVALAAAGVVQSRRPGVAGPRQSVFMLGLSGLALGCGAPALVDVRFDASPGQAFRATVNSMYVNQGRSTSYHLRLGAWGPAPADSVTVSRSLYDQFNPGDQACVALHAGALAIPWFAVRTCLNPS